MMHYGPKAFTTNGQPTIIPKQSGVDIGQREGFSEVDIRKVNKLYHCLDSGPAPIPPTLGPTIRPDMVKKPRTRLFGHYTQSVSPNARSCFAQCLQSARCMARPWPKPRQMVSPFNCFLFGPGHLETREMGWITFMKGRERDQQGARFKRAFNHYATPNVHFPLQCRSACLKRRSECGAASFIDQKGIAKCFLFRYGRTVK